MTTRRILIRAGKHPFTVLSPEASLAFYKSGTFAGNFGNVLYADSVTKAVSAPGVEVVPNSLLTERPDARKASYAQRVNDEFDALVLPMANAFKPKFVPQLKVMTKVIERLTIPVTVIGVGVQWDRLHRDAASMGPEVNEVIRRFAAAVLERSASIGVRGQMTKDYLLALGFADEQVDVIGCPSLFRDATPPAVETPAPLDAESRIAVSVTPKLSVLYPILERHVERYPNLVYVPQEANEYALQMYGEPVPYFRGKPTATGKLVKDRRAPLHWEHPLYQQDRIRCFVDATTWFDFMREQDFAFGTRLHGTVAALASGIPAVLLTHDSRTMELAQYHRMPALPLELLPPTVDAAELAAQGDYAAFNEERAHGFSRYVAFLEKNDIDHIFKHDGAAEAWEAQLASKPFPGPIHTLMAPEGVFRRELAQRLTWLRQGYEEDAKRTVGAYEVPFDGAPTPEMVRAATPPPPPAPPTPREQVGIVDAVRVDFRRAKRALRRVTAAGPANRPGSSTS